MRKYPLTGGELDGAKIDAQLSFPAQIAKSLTALRVGPRTEIGDKAVYLVQGNGPRGSVASLYFDRESGLLLRIIRYTPSKIGKVPTQVDYEDYRTWPGSSSRTSGRVTCSTGADSFEFTDVKFQPSDRRGGVRGSRAAVSKSGRLAAPSTSGAIVVEGDRRGRL